MHATTRLNQRFQELASQLEEVEATRYLAEGLLSGTHEALDREALLGWCVRVRNLLANACGKDSEHFLSFVQEESAPHHGGPTYTLRRVRAVFLAAKEDFEGGYITSLRNLVQVEVFDSELDQARELLTAGYSVPAAVVAGVVLEAALRSVCQSKNLPVGKLDRMNSDLAKAGQYNSLVQKRITALAALRNSAAHGLKHDFDASDVASMIESVEKIVEVHLS
jgi:hypothetical protein